MDFTREPIIETIITSKEGCKLVVRNSKNVGQEEYFVDAVEVVSFGSGLFFRSIERPKVFLVPASDYEVLEVREARMILKNVGVDRSIKIGGGKQDSKPLKESFDKQELPSEENLEPQRADSETKIESLVDGKLDKKRDRRRHQRRRRGKDEGILSPESSSEEGSKELEQKKNPETQEGEEFSLPILQEKGNGNGDALLTPASVIATLLPPPPTLISETIARYKNDALFKGAFFSKDGPSITLEEEKVELEGQEEAEIQRLREEKAPYEEEGSLQGTLEGTFIEESEVEKKEEEILPSLPFSEEISFSEEEKIQEEDLHLPSLTFPEEITEGEEKHSEKKVSDTLTHSNDS